MNTKKLIFDIGSNRGEDSLFYVSRGYQVIAVDADVSLVDENKRVHKDHLDKIIFLNFAITETDNNSLDLFINHDSGKTSLIEEIGNRQNSFKEKAIVRTITLRTLIEQYGLPHYCKIDIEGYDIVAVRSLIGTGAIPPFISVEAECLPEEERFSERQIFDSLEILREAGYTRFKLVDQASLRVLDSKDHFYRRSTSLLFRIIRQLQLMLGVYSRLHNNKKFLGHKYQFPFGYSSSGPFGDELNGKWMNYDEAKRTYMFQRRQYFSVERNRQYSYWADWHAAL